MTQLTWQQIDQICREEIDHHQTEAVSEGTDVADVLKSLGAAEAVCQVRQRIAGVFEGNETEVKA